jgi:hypothetical protein
MILGTLDAGEVSATCARFRDRFYTAHLFHASLGVTDMNEPISYCSRCDQDKPESAFAFEARRGLQPWCRPCKTEYTRELRRQRREDESAD